MKLFVDHRNVRCHWAISKALKISRVTLTVIEEDIKEQGNLFARDDRQKLRYLPASVRP